MLGSGYNTSQALKALPKFMPTPQKATVRFMVSDVELNKHKNKTHLADHPRLYSSVPTMLVCLALRLASTSRLQGTVGIYRSFSSTL